MRAAHGLLFPEGMLAGLVAVAVAVASAEEPLTPPPMVSSWSLDEEASDGPHLLGLALDAGVPDGVGLGLSVRPWSWLRLQLSALSNLACYGVRGGLLIEPFQSAVRPTLSAEVGHFFPGDARELLPDEAPKELGAALQGVSYDYAAAHLGLELGSSRVALYLRLGAAFVDGSVPGLSSALGGTGLSPGEARVRLFIPSARLGLGVYFL